MKRWLALLLSLSFAFSLYSCGRSYGESRTVIDRYVALSKENGRIYSSLAGPESAEYISSDFRSVMFGDSPLSSDFTLFITSHLDLPREIGVFRSDSGDARLRLSEDLMERVMLLRSLSDGDGEVFIISDLVIYCFGNDVAEMKEKILNILS